MAREPDWDYLVVGQGLAGSLLAWRLRELGRRVLVVDDAHRGSASLAAAGLVNPLAGLRFSLPPAVDAWRAEATALYGRLERHFGRQYFHAVPMLRLFRSPEQIRFWERRAADPRADAYLGKRFGPETAGEPVHAPYGGFHQHRTGYLDVPALLGDIRTALQEAGCLRTTALDYRAVRFSPDHVEWEGLRAARLACCDGHRLADNPWFDWLPLATDRGEILTLDPAPGLPRRIVNGAHWLVPLASGGCRVGSTHDHHRTDSTPTADAREAILAGTRAMLAAAPALRVREHRAGVRPGSADRHPFAGCHPQHPRLAVLNGFGAKGSLTLPWYSARLVAHLEHGAALPVEADIARFGTQS